MKEIFERVSIRRYENRKVEEGKVEALLRAAMAAPSAGNQQPWEFYVVQDPETCRQLSETTPYARCAGGAPLVIVPCLRTQGVRFPECGMIDMAMACQNILLEAVSQGLGGVILAVAPTQERMDNVRSVLAIPETLSPFAMIAVGYAAEERTAQDRYDPARIHFAD